MPPNFQPYPSPPIQPAPPRDPPAADDNKKNLAEFNSLVSNARQLISTGNAAMAIESLDKATKLRPGNLSVYFYRGLAYDESGDPSKAYDDYALSLRKAKSIGMDSSELRVNLGNSLTKLGFYKEALYDYQRALEIDPKNGAAHLYLGRALLQKGDYKEALKNFRRCDELGFTHPSLPILKALALSSIGETQEAKNELNSMLNPECEKKTPLLYKMAVQLNESLR